jgi:hypothetical protein
VISITSRINLGAKILDTFFHTRRWRERVVLERLDMDSMKECILGHVFGDYRDGVAQLDLTLEETINFGFTQPRIKKDRRLTKAWRDFLNKNKDTK